jgi:ferrous iron transport protein B
MGCRENKNNCCAENNNENNNIQNKCKKFRNIEKHFGPQSALLIGNLKVGKSSIFSWYAGRRRQHVCYPKTNVELAVGHISAHNISRIIDIPGLYSLYDKSEDAFVARDLLLRGAVGAVVLVLDSKNIRRGLPLAFQLSEFEVPVVVALNMNDEARQRGVKIDKDKLAELLGVPVIPCMASESMGRGALRRAIGHARPLKIKLRYSDEIEKNIKSIKSVFDAKTDKARIRAVLTVAGVPKANQVFDDFDQQELNRKIEAVLNRKNAKVGMPASLSMAKSAQTYSDELVDQVVQLIPVSKVNWLMRLSVWTRKPLSGIPIAMVVLFLVYLFVGLFGATILVDLLEGKFFGQLVLPIIAGWIEHIPWQWVQEMLIGQFGLITVGLTLSLGIVLPVLATFFFAFSLLEDSGYLPRLSLLLDRILRKIGLNGKAVLPMIMGFSCVTMAIITTRMLDSKKQRLITSVLLLLAIPCAPMLSVVFVLLAKFPAWVSLVYFGVLLVQIILIGVIGNLAVPGRRPDFVLELTPLRAPRISNIVIKTVHQITWFLKEAIPYFLIGALMLFVLEQLGVLTALRDGFEPVSERLLGLPAQSADVFFMTFVRREAGAALLAQQVFAGMYDGTQLVVALVVMTLLTPCINSVLVFYKERGILVSTVILLFSFVNALAVGGLLAASFQWLGVSG